MLPLVVVVLVAAGDAADPTTTKAIQTTKRALEPDATVLAIETQAPPTDASALSIGLAQHADAIIVIAWSPDHDRAHLRVRSAAGTWAERDIGFAHADAPEERGRALGLVAATMVPGPAPEPPPPPPPPPLPPPPPPPPPIWRASIELGPSLGVGVDTAGVSIGTALTGAVRIVGWLWAHVTGDVRFGGLDRAPSFHATATWFSAGAGAGVRAPIARDFWLGARGQLELLGTSLAAAEGTGLRASPGAGVLVEGAWQPARFGVRLGLGSDFAFEKTTVFANGSVVGQLPTWRLRTEIAALIAF